MLKEAIQHVESLAQRAASARVVNIPGDGKTAFVEQNGSLARIPVTPPLRQHTVASVADLVKSAERWEHEEWGNVVWISCDKLVLVIDDSDRRETVTMPLVESYVFSRIKALAKNPVVDQAALVRLLRVDLRGVVNATALLTAVRKLKFRQAESGHADIQHGNESMGRQIEAEVTGADAIPDSLVVETNLYSNPGLDEQKFTIGLDLEIDVKNQRFLLRPVPDEIEKVTAAQLASIRAEIEEADSELPVFFGRP
jgi:hypothetical protein